MVWDIMLRGDAMGKTMLVSGVNAQNVFGGYSAVRM